MDSIDFTLTACKNSNIRIQNCNKYLEKHNDTQMNNAKARLVTIDTAPVCLFYMLSLLLL